MRAREEGKERGKIGEGGRREREPTKLRGRLKEVKGKRVKKTERKEEAQ